MFASIGVMSMLGARLATMNGILDVKGLEIIGAT
jgi:hypothetical protein